jgi:putative FmdB family regulatory protein
MPRYDYEVCEGGCDFCGGRFEVSQPMSDPPLSECPMCDRPVRRCFSAPAVKVVRSNAELRDLGLMKLEKRADGTYENLTRRKDEPRIIDPHAPEAGGDCAGGACAPEGRG